MAAKVRLRIIAVKYGDSTFREQGKWWRDVGRANPHIVKDKPFQQWIKENFEQLRLLVLERQNN